MVVKHAFSVPHLTNLVYGLGRWVFPLLDRRCGILLGCSGTLCFLRKERGYQILPRHMFELSFTDDRFFEIKFFTEIGEVD